jgi:hypothetical protein
MPYEQRKAVARIKNLKIPPLRLDEQIVRAECDVIAAAGLASAGEPLITIAAVGLIFGRGFDRSAAPAFDRSDEAGTYFEK